MTWDEILIYYEYITKLEQERAELYGREAAVRVISFMNGKDFDKEKAKYNKERERIRRSTKDFTQPDMEKWESKYGNIIKRPEKGINSSESEHTVDPADVKVIP